MTWYRTPLLLLVIIALELSLEHTAGAQQVGRTKDDQRLAAGVVNTLDRWLKASPTDRLSEEQIAALEKALRTEPQIKQWTMGQRAIAKGTLLFGLGHAYRNRTHGPRADNLEKAIAHLDAALQVYPRRAGRQRGEGDCGLPGRAHG